MKHILCFFIIIVMACCCKAQPQQSEILFCRIPNTNFYNYFYDDGYHDICRCGKYSEYFDLENYTAIDTQQVIKENIKRIEFANDHYGFFCYLFDMTMTNDSCWANVFVPQESRGAYSFVLTSSEKILIQYALSQLSDIDSAVYLKNIQEENCRDCNGAEIIRIQKNSVNHEYFVDALADNVPENISFLCGVFGAIIQNHCLQVNKLSDDVEISSIRFLLEEKGKEYNCPLGLIGEPAPPPPHRYSRSKNVLKRHIRCSALGKTHKK